MANAAEVREKTIPLVEMFGPTIQGEGNVIGQQTYFLRFGLCDYRCRMCDSLHAVIPAMVKAHARWLTQSEIEQDFYQFYKPNSTRWVTFSGGNPVVHDLSNLVYELHKNDFRINVETQGTLFREWLWHVDNLTISPKGPGMGETHDQEQFLRFLDAVVTGMPMETPVCVKVVIFDQRDIDFAAEIFAACQKHPLFQFRSKEFYLSQGNPNPPDPTDPAGTSPPFDPAEQIRMYKTLYEDISTHPVLSQCRWLPQWHAFVWGNDAGH